MVDGTSGPGEHPGEGEQGAGGEGRTASVPTPVRSAMAGPGSQAEEADEPPRPSVTLEVEGTTWVVRETGQASAGPRAAPLPLLLVGFFPGDDAEAPALEAWAPARGLDDLTPAALEAAFRRAHAPPAGGRKALFPEIATKGDRRDG